MTVVTLPPDPFVMVPTVASLAEDPDTAAARFWDTRPELGWVHDWAKSRMASPWATLGVILVRVLSQVPPSCVLPPIIGDDASLNLFLAIVAKSGQGKGAAMGVAKRALDVGNVELWPLGTGEGIVKSYVAWDEEGGELKQHETSVVFEVAEIDTYAAIAARRGSTLTAVVRSAWMGETLGFGNSEKERRLRVLEHNYRFGLIAGVQPSRGQALLNSDEIAGGTPQRFLWMPGVDPEMPEITPPMPKPRVWRMPSWPGDAQFTSGHQVLEVWPGAVEIIRRAQRDRARGEGDALDGHALLCQEKVAAALAIFSGHLWISKEDWQLSEVVMAVSNQTRQMVADALSKEAAQQNRIRGEAEADRAVVVETKVADAAVKQACQTVLRKLGKADTAMRHADLRRGVRANIRSHFDEAIERLIETGQVEAQNVTYRNQPGVQYRLSDSRK